MDWKIITNLHTDRICRGLWIKYSKERRQQQRSIDAFLDQAVSSSDKRSARSMRILSMKIGFLWQELAGEMAGVTNHKNGHHSGIDLEGDEFVMELKNQKCTDNKSSRDQNYCKLLRYANLRQKRAIYGIINDGVDIRSGRTETITTQDGVIVIYSGRTLREFLFGQYREEVEACVVEAIRSIKSVLDVLFSKNEL